jgi:hypothetical protein
MSSVMARRSAAGESRVACCNLPEIFAFFSLEERVYSRPGALGQLRGGAPSIWARLAKVSCAWL